MPVLIAPPAVTGVAKVGETLTGSEGTWSHSPTTFSYQWLSCDATGANCVAIEGADGATYRVPHAQLGHRLSLQVTASNFGGSGSSATSSPTVEIEVQPLVANAGEDLDATVGEPTTFDGSGSTPAAEIIGYEWSFGDGTTGSGAITTHIYNEPGTYTATLTIVENGGVRATATTTVVARSAPEKSPTVKVVDADGEPIAGAEVVYVSPEGSKSTATTGDDGVAELAQLPEGPSTVYAYREGYQPGTGELVVSNGAGDTTITLQTGAVATTSVSAHEITPAEAQADGINVSEPANQTVVGFSVGLDLVAQGSRGGSGGGGQSESVSLKCNVNAEGNFVGMCEGQGFGGGWTCSGGGCQSPGGSVSAANVNGHRVLQWLVLHGTASIIKQFYDVNMVITNLSEEPFTLSKGQATLNLPDGMSLAPTTEPQSATKEVANVAGLSSAEVEWVIRGDLPGSYNLSAEFHGVLEPFEAPVELSAGVAQPVRIWGGEALSVSVQAEETRLEFG